GLGRGGPLGVRGGRCCVAWRAGCRRCWRLGRIRGWCCARGRPEVSLSRPGGSMRPPHDVTAISDSELDEIMARCNAATPGPWRSFIEGRDHLGGADFIMTGEDDQRGPDIELLGATQADQMFIAHARQDIPRLVAEVRRLKRIPRESE